MLFAMDFYSSDIKCYVKKHHFYIFMVSIRLTWNFHELN